MLALQIPQVTLSLQWTQYQQKKNGFGVTVPVLYGKYQNMEECMLKLGQGALGSILSWFCRHGFESSYSCIENGNGKQNVFSQLTCPSYFNTSQA